MKGNLIFTLLFLTMLACTAEPGFACFDSMALVAVNLHEYKKIGDFQVGDEVYRGVMQGTKFTWNRGPVTFSAGTSDTRLQVMLHILFDGEEGKRGELYVTRDQLFLVPGGKLVQAMRLVPSVDKLLSADGKPLMIRSISTGNYRRGIHHIATGKEFTGTLDNHLILVNGVIAGDYLLQVHFQQLYPERINGPSIGTKQYSHDF